MKKLVQTLSDLNYTIASIESLSAGMFASMIADVPKASKVLKGSLVTYQTIVKEQVLGIDSQLLNTYGVVSSECAKAMVIQGKEMFQSDIVVSCTGNAGPSVMENKPVGLVYMGVNICGQIYLYEEVFQGSRKEIREQVCIYLRERILEVLQ